MTMVIMTISMVIMVVTMVTTRTTTTKVWETGEDMVAMEIMVVRITADGREAFRRQPAGTF